MKTVKTCVALIIILAGLTLCVACNDNGANKYSLSSNWQTLPESASQPVDVFFSLSHNLLPRSGQQWP